MSNDSASDSDGSNDSSTKETAALIETAVSVSKEVRAALLQILDSWFHCGTCGRTLYLMGERGFELYFRQDTGACPQCGTKIDLRRVLLDAVVNNFMLTGAYTAMGAQTHVFSFDIAASETKELKFKEVGVPDGASILAINYSLQGGTVFPIELHGNTPRWSPPEESVWLFGRQFLHESQDPSASVSCALTWMKAPDEDDGWSHLLDAYRAYGSEQWRSMIHPANIAAESSIARALYDAVAARTSKKAAQDFLSKGATYSHQLNVMLPIMSALENVPPLDPVVRGDLGRLRKLRNDLAHTGSVEKPLERQEAAQLLVAATLGFQYGRFFRRALAGTVQTALPEDVYTAVKWQDEP